MCDKSRNTWLCVHWQWNTLEWCQLNALQASPVVHLVTPLSCVSLSMNTQPSVPVIKIWLCYRAVFMHLGRNGKLIRKRYHRRGNTNCTLPVASFLIITSKIYTRLYMYMIVHVNNYYVSLQISLAHQSHSCLTCLSCGQPGISHQPGINCLRTN